MDFSDIILKKISNVNESKTSESKANDVNENAINEARAKIATGCEEIAKNAESVINNVVTLNKNDFELRSALPIGGSVVVYFENLDEDGEGVELHFRKGMIVDVYYTGFFGIRSSQKEDYLSTDNIDSTIKYLKEIEKFINHIIMYANAHGLCKL